MSPLSGSVARTAALAMFALFGSTQAVYQIDTTDNIKATAAQLAWDLMRFYKGNQTGEIPGILPGPPSENKGDYYWWEGGAMMGTYVDYWHATGDSTYNDLVMTGMTHQAGENRDYMPKNHTASLGNDDQGFWGMTAMLAAENRFPNPPDDKPQWLALAQAVWTTQADPKRHDETCGGGMRWQIPFSNVGYNYKNTIANGCFFNIGARLARYTKNDTYAEHAEAAWDWLWSVNYIDHDTWQVYDGGHVEHNCTDINKATFSYNAGVLIQGAAFLYNYTDGSEKWKGRLENLLDSALSTFYPDNIAYEVACEPRKGACTPDMLSFKGYLTRWLAQVSQIAPFTAEKIRPVIKTSAEAAVKQCTGGATGRVCGFYWHDGNFTDPRVDKTSGAGEAMNVLAVVNSLLVDQTPAPVTNETGGISKGDVNAGSDSNDKLTEHKPITMGDKAGAGILTFLLLGGAVGSFAWMSWD